MTISEARGTLPTLPGRYYYDPAIHAAERERIFGRGWLCVGYAAQLAEAGDYLTVSVGLPVSGQQLLDEPQADAVRLQLCPLQRRLQMPRLLAVPALCCSAAHVAQQHAVPARPSQADESRQARKT